MVIKEAIRKAHRNLKQYGGEWHCVSLATGFEVVSKTYFENPAPHKQPSLYNTTDRVYNEKNVEEILVYNKTGDLLTTEEQYICHQCNCVSTSGGGLAYYLFEKFPFSDVYQERDSGELDEKNWPILKYKDKVGTIKIRGNGQDKRFVVNMFSQFYPGGINNYPNDSVQKREDYFKQCLDEIKKIPNLESIAFPYEIGCGIAGGDWTKYRKMIFDFAIDVDAKVVVVYKPGTERLKLN